MAASIVPAVAATVAAGAYLNAKLGLSGDLHFLTALAGSQKDFAKRQEAKRGNIFYKLEEHAQNPKIANAIFLIYEGKSWTFKQFYDVVLRYAGWLHAQHNVVAGEIVALDFMNCPAFLFLVVAIWSLGASPALINCNLTSKPLIHSVRVSTARILILDPEVATQRLTAEVKDAFSSPDFRNGAFPLECTILDEGFQKSLNYYPRYRAPDEVRVIDKPSQIALLMFTSGTTGMPKAAVQPWSRCGIAGELTAKMLGLRPVTHKEPDRFYTCMPLYHTTGFTLGFNACFQSATTLVIGRKFSVSRFWPEIVSSKVTIIQYVGETLRYILAALPTAQDKDHRVRMAFGNGLRPDVWTRFKARFGIDTISEIYGMTEGVGATWNINRNNFTDGAIGNFGAITQFMLRKQLSIVKVDWETEKPWRDPKTGFCKPTPRGEVGELIMALDPAAIEDRFVGYLGNKEATNSKILRNVFKKGDAWFRSGDVVRFDSQGRLWYSDRIGDTFRWKSENVSTAEVSEVLGHHPSVLEANVYGVKVPGHEGRAGCATMLLRENVLLDPVTPKPDVLESLATYSTNSLPKYAVPLFLRIAKEVTLTGNNKQQKTGLRDQGIDLTAIRQAGSFDKIYWLKPGASTYVEFQTQDSQALEAAKVRL